MARQTSDLHTTMSGSTSISLFRDLPTHTKEQILVHGTSGKPKVYNCVHGLIPDELQEALVADFSEYERHEIFHRIDVYQAECDHIRPKALWIFGPPAVGKTTISNERAVEMFGWPDNAVTVDGADFRMVHKGFQMVAQHGLRNNLLHADAWKLLKGSGWMDVLKTEVVELAISNRQHLKIPETAVNIKRVNSMLEQLVAANYELHAVCLYAPCSETEARGRPRGVKDGKAFTTKEYSNATKNALFYGKQWLDKIMAGDPHYKSVMFYDNTVFPCRPVHYSEFEQLSNLSEDDANLHAKASKAKRVAHIRSDIAASEARAQSKGGVRAALTAWFEPFKRRKSATELDGSQSRPLQHWSLTQSHQVTDIVKKERRRGHIEGLIAGICISVVAVVARSYLGRR